jgi:hypothetical protein
MDKELTSIGREVRTNELYSSDRLCMHLNFFFATVQCSTSYFEYSTVLVLPTHLSQLLQ